MTFKEIENKKIHFIGVGGIGMSGLAQLLHGRGVQVSGSDLCENGNIKRLEALGIQIYIGQSASNIVGKDMIVVSTDIKSGNPEWEEAKAQELPILHRSDMLAILTQDYHTVAVSGTHGKTTTTALAGWVFEKATLHPTIIDGGIMQNFNSNVKAGSGHWCIAEADESDGSFLKLPREIALITNIDSDHMDYYKSMEELYEAFETFAHCPRVAVLGIDHPQVYDLWQRIQTNQHCITYGLHHEADVRAEHIEMTPQGATFDIVTREERFKVNLSLYGQHNVLNALGVAAVALECGITSDIINLAFSTFEGVDRRFTYVGEWNGVTIIDDYGHHPVEIRTTLNAAKQITKGRVIAVLEPHRFSRLEHLFEEFGKCCEEADLTIVLPVYGSRELPREGITHEALVTIMEGHVTRCDAYEDLPKFIFELAKPGDMVICLGAGSISSLAHSLPSQLNQLDKTNYKKVTGGG
jgi:UDP-N-acetylmuramate--alanine ligase